MTATTVDLRRELRDLYSATSSPALLDVPELPFLMIDGHGDPNTAPVYRHAVQALYSVAYAVRFALKRAGVDARVMPLEGLWWTPDMSTFSTEAKSDWNWTLMILLPGQATSDVVEEARTRTAQQKGLEAIGRVRFERFAEGRAAQVLHVGPYSAEQPTVAALHAFIAEQGCLLSGKHHEIYLGDPRRAAPERLRTIIRQPLARPQDQLTAAVLPDPVADPPVRELRPISAGHCPSARLGSDRDHPDGAPRESDDDARRPDHRRRRGDAAGLGVGLRGHPRGG